LKTGRLVESKVYSHLGDKPWATVKWATDQLGDNWVNLSVNWATRAEPACYTCSVSRLLKACVNAYVNY